MFHSVSSIISLDYLTTELPWHIFFSKNVFFIFIFWPYLQRIQVPGPGIKPMPPQRQCWVLNPLCHSGDSQAHLSQKTKTFLGVVIISQGRADNNLLLGSSPCSTFFIFKLFFGCTHSTWKCPGQGSNPCHSSDNARSFTLCVTREFLGQHLF